jgi:hypothetical protein
MITVMITLERWSLAEFDSTVAIAEFLFAVP